MNVLASLVLFAQEETKFEAPNKWLPENAEILWGTISFLIIVFLLWKFAAGPIAKSLKGRTQRIAEQIESAAETKAEAEAEVAAIRQNLADAGTERERMLAEANETAERLRVEGVARNDAEVADLEARAAADLVTMRNRAMSELQGQIAQWAGQATERIIMSQLDDATLDRLVEEEIAKIGASA
jgi:F-type H+-transporting ATPase subunit b